MGNFSRIVLIVDKREPADFVLNDPYGRGDRYDFVIFHTPMMFSHDGKNYFPLQENTCILFEPFVSQFYYANNAPMKNSFLILSVEKSYFKKFSFQFNTPIKLTDKQVEKLIYLMDRASYIINTDLEPWAMKDVPIIIDHIFHKQLFGIAITELTSLLSRRSLYCSKYPNGEYSVSHFDSPEGNIRYRRIQHTWVNGKCKFCGASKDQWERGNDKETYAYEFIHTLEPEKIFNMKFDVIISNPPYQLDTVVGDTTNVSKQAKPIYNLFVQQAKKLNPRYLSMIIPSRWFAGGLGLDSFRQEMMEDKHITKLIDFTNAKDCFPQNSVSGGVCYFLWEREQTGLCSFTNISGNKVTTENRSLSEFPVVVRYNAAVDIIRKVRATTNEYLKEIVSPISPFAIPTKVTGAAQKNNVNILTLYTSKGIGYCPTTEVKSNSQYIPMYKIMVSQIGAEHAGEPGKDGKFRVLTSSMRVLLPNEVCTNSYVLIGKFDNKQIADNLLEYLRLKFVRFLVLQAVSSIHISKTSFTFVPMQDFSKPWTDEELYKKYNLTQEEIDFIESMIKPME